MPTRKTTTTRRTAAPKPAPAPDATVVSETPVSVTEQLGKKALIERAVIRSGLKKRDVKPSVEAALAVIGEALAAGESLNLEPLGKVHVKRRKTLANGEVLTARIRRKRPGASVPVPAPEVPSEPAE